MVKNLQKWAPLTKEFLIEDYPCINLVAIPGENNDLELS
jgi:hypothetical protein